MLELTIAAFLVLDAFYSKKPRGAEGGIIGNLDTLGQQGSQEKALYDAAEIFLRAQEVSKERKFQESFEVNVKLNVDPTQGD